MGRAILLQNRTAQTRERLGAYDRERWNANMADKQPESEKTSIQLHYVYAHADGIFSHELDKRLELLRRQGTIVAWSKHEITSDTDGTYVFDEHLAIAQIILLLLSPDFLKLDFCYGTGIQQALARHDAGEAIVLPIILRPVDLALSPFADLSTLPDNEKPISIWPDQDEAYLNLVEGIQDAVRQLSYSQHSGNRQKLLHERSATVHSAPNNRQPVKLFYVYTGEDQHLRNQLEKHLAILQQQGFLSEWICRNILGEATREDEIDAYINTAQIMLILISPDFLVSEYCVGPEMQRILEQHVTGKATVIPVILRPTFWKDMPFSELPPLPADGLPVTSWSNLDAAFLSIVQGIRKVIATPSSSLTLEEKEQEHIDLEETFTHMPITYGPIKIFYSYADEDEVLMERLRAHLAVLKRQAVIVDFDHWIEPGLSWKEIINERLQAAQIILPLLSADYFVSDYTEMEMQRALERARAGEAVIIPIILRPVDWSYSPFRDIVPLPTNGRPVTSWENVDEAFYDIVQGLRKVVLQLATRSQQETKEQYILEGKTHYDAARYEDALAAYKRALMLDPGDESVSSITSRVLLQLGRYEEALTLYEDQLRMSPSDSASPYLFKGIALQHLGRLTEALTAYQKVREHGFAG